MQTVLRDLRFGAKMFVRERLFTAVAVAMLALGIGANTAIFSVVNAVLLRALPYRDADRLIALDARSANDRRALFSIEELEAFQQRMQTLEGLATSSTQSVNLTGGERPARVRGAFVSASFFDVFAVRPVVGRSFAAGEDRPGAARVAIVSERLWRERLSSDSALLNARLTFNGEPHAIIGVVPERFQQPFDAEAIDVWLPVSSFPGERGSRYFHGLGYLTLEYRLPRNKYPEAADQAEVHRRIVEEIRAVPGVESVALVGALPFSGNGGAEKVTFPDRPPAPPGPGAKAALDPATPSYFETLGIDLLQGRLFDDRARLGSPVELLINETMARIFWPDQSAIGKSVSWGGYGLTATVVGVVGDARHFGLEERPLPQGYVPFAQWPDPFATVVIRTPLEPMTLVEPVRQAIWRADPEQPVWKIRTLESLVERSLVNKKFLVTLVGVFASLALLLTWIGLYGVIRYLVDRRTAEIGIRMALGARPEHLVRWLSRQGMQLVALGLVLGLGAAWLTTRLIERQLYGVSATDVPTFLLIAVSFLPIAWLACYLPARRAASIDPVLALRHE